jgi:hypothetical protein
VVKSSIHKRDPRYVGKMRGGTATQFQGVHDMAMNGDLVPQHDGEGSSWELIPDGKPEEFGVDSPGPANGKPSTKNYTVEKRRVWNRQEAFLAAYRKCGKIGRAAEAVGLTRWAVDWWLRHNVFEFHRRIEAAHADYCERWEQGMYERLQHPQGNRGSDILLMFKMKAENPAKYRENSPPVARDEGRELLDRLTEMARKEIEERRRLEAGATEGEYRDIGEKGQGSSY